MRSASYVSFRQDTKSYIFRWVIPASIRQLLGGKREVKRALGTQHRRLALRLARRLAVMLERATAQLMADRICTQEQPAAHLTAKLIERLVDGSLRIEGLELDPQHGEEDRKHLAALLGTSGAKAANADDGRKLRDLIAAYFDEGDRAKRCSFSCAARAIARRGMGVASCRMKGPNHGRRSRQAAVAGARLVSLPHRSLPWPHGPDWLGSERARI
jgi:uncharacterized protein DUF6538